MAHDCDRHISAQIVHALRAHRNLMTLRLAELDPPLYPGQEFILGQLWGQEDQTQGCLAGRVGIDASTLTKALQRLERYGLVERHADPADTRVSRVSLTERGRELCPRIEAIWQEIEAETLRGFTPEEATQLQSFLRRIQENLT